MKAIELKEGGILWRFFTRFNFEGKSIGQMIPDDSCEFFQKLWTPMFKHLFVILVLQSWMFFPLSFIEGIHNGPLWLETYDSHPILAFFLFFLQFVTMIVAGVCTVIGIIFLLACGVVKGYRYVRRKWFPTNESGEESNFAKTAKLIHSKAKKYCIPIEWK